MLLWKEESSIDLPQASHYLLQKAEILQHSVAAQYLVALPLQDHPQQREQGVVFRLEPRVVFHLHKAHL
jgi:hypothetical protein